MAAVTPVQCPQERKAGLANSKYGTISTVWLTFCPYQCSKKMVTRSQRTLKGNWIVTSPKGTKIIFKWDTGVCRGMPYIDLREHQAGISMIETVQKNFEGVTKIQLNKAITARVLQRRIGHPPEERYKE